MRWPEKVSEQLQARQRRLLALIPFSTTTIGNISTIFFILGVSILTACSQSPAQTPPDQQVGQFDICGGGSSPSEYYGTTNARYHQLWMDFVEAAKGNPPLGHRQVQRQFENSINPRALRWGVVLEQYDAAELRCWVGEGDDLAAFALAMALKFNESSEARSERITLLRRAAHAETPQIIESREAEAARFDARELFPIGCNARLSLGELECQDGLPEAQLELAIAICREGGVTEESILLYRRARQNGLWNSAMSFSNQCGILAE